MPALDELIDELRGEGEVDSRGRFTLDPAKAREKMRRFQLVLSVRRGLRTHLPFLQVVLT